MALKIGELFATLEIDDKDFSKGLQSAQNQTKVLSSAIAASEKTVSRYQSELSKAQSSLRSAEQAQAQLNQRLETARSAQSSLQSEVSRLTDAYKAQVAMTGENSDAANELGLRLIEAKQALEQSGEEVQKLTQQSQKGEQQLRKLGKSVDEISSNLDSAEQSLSGFQSQLSAANSVLSSSAARLNAAGQAMQEYGKSVQSATEWQNKLGNLLTVGVTTPVVGAFTYAAKEVISFEDAFAGVEKTVDGTDEQLAALESSLVEMSHNLPVTAEGLAAIAESAGQLGIELDVIDEFTETMAKLESATNLGEEGATILARFANITGMDKTGENFERLGSAIVELGNTSATTESEIANMAMRLAGAGAQVGMTESEILGISAALSSLGLQAEAGGSAISRVLTDMQLAVETGSDSLEQFASVAGMTADEFAAAFRENAAGALAEFIAGLGSGTASATQLLDEMGITEVVITDTLKRASNATDLFSASIESASSAWDENIALTNEAAKRNQTMASRITMVKNRVDTAARSLGNTLMPVIEDVVEAIGEAADWFASLDEATVRNVATWGALAAAIGPALKLLKTANDTVGKVIGKIGEMAQTVSSIGSLGGALSTLGKTISGLLGPVGIAAAAAAAGYAAYKFIDWASGAAAARENLERLNEVAQEWAETNAQTVYDTGNADPLARFGMSEGDFSTSLSSAQDWMDQLMQVWTDGEVETDAQVEQFVGAFTEASDAIREKIQSQSNTAEAYGVTLSADAKAKMEEDLAKLDAYDAEIEALLNKRQGGFLTEEEQARLNDVIQLRAELELEYSGGDGYDQIITNMQAEVARLQASGETDATVFGDTLNALAQGREAYNQALAESYNAEYAQISAIDDEAARLAALEELNTRYNQKRLEGEQAYQQAVREAGSQTWEANAEGFDAQVNIIKELGKALGNIDEIDFSDKNNPISTLTESLDEGQLASMLALIEQLKASGMSDDEIFAETGVNATELLSTIQQIRDTASEIEGLESLSEMFGESLPEEVTDILIGLDMTQAAADWEAFMEGKDPWETEGTVQIELSPLDQAAIDAWKAANAGVELEGPPARVGLELGDDWKSDLVSAFNQGKLALYGEDGLPLEVTPEVLDALNGNDILMGVDENGVYHVTVVPSADTPEGAFALADYELESRTSLIDVPSDYAGRLRDLAQSINDYNYAVQNGETGNASAYATEIEEIGAALSTGLSAEDGAGFETVAQYVANGLELLNQGKLSEGQAEELLGIVENLQTILDFDFSQVSGEMEETGANISAGIAQGFTQYGWENDAQAVASSLKGAIDSAFLVGSPSQLMVPTGGFVAAGIGQGMGLYDFSADSALLVSNLQSAIGAALGTGEGPAAGMASIGASIPAGIGQGLAQYSFATDAVLLATNLQGALSSAFAGTASMNAIGMGQSAGLALGLTSYSFAPATSTMASAITSSMSGYSNSLWASGYNLSFGMAQGILSGQSTVINAAVRVAQAAIRAANNTLEVHSPSRVLMETGQNAGQGLAIGMMNEISAVERASQSVASALIEGSTVRNPALRAAVPYHESRQRRETLSIDYDRLAQAMARLNIRLDYDGRTVGRIGAEDTARGQAEYRRSTALGFGY